MASEGWVVAQRPPHLDDAGGSCVPEVAFLNGGETAVVLRLRLLVVVSSIKYNEVTGEVVQAEGVLLCRVSLACHLSLCRSCHSSAAVTSLVQGEMIHR